jgi:hypothetical protein
MSEKRKQFATIVAAVGVCWRGPARSKRAAEGICGVWKISEETRLEAAI